jgi:hypothetical protein
MLAVCNHTLLQVASDAPRFCYWYNKLCTYSKLQWVKNTQHLFEIFYSTISNQTRSEDSTQYVLYCPSKKTGEVENTLYRLA